MAQQSWAFNLGCNVVDQEVMPSDRDMELLSDPELHQFYLKGIEIALDDRRFIRVPSKS